jgi:hypothetical protein
MADLAMAESVENNRQKNRECMKNSFGREFGLILFGFLVLQLERQSATFSSEHLVGKNQKNRFKNQLPPCAHESNFILSTPMVAKVDVNQFMCFL